MPPLIYRTVRDHELNDAQHLAIRLLMNAAFEEDFSDADDNHCNGGVRVIAIDDDQIIGHAALISRTITIAGAPYRTGYVEGVVVWPARQRQGIGRQIMRQITDMAAHDYVISMLSTGEHDFYTKFGWERFVGESYVDDHGTITRTADEDEGLMVLTKLTHLNQSDVAFVCDWRTGDVW